MGGGEPGLARRWEQVPPLVPAPELNWGFKPGDSRVSVKTMKGVHSILAQGRCCQEGSRRDGDPGVPPSLPSEKVSPSPEKWILLTNSFQKYLLSVCGIPGTV